MQTNILRALVGTLAFRTSLAAPTARGNDPKDNTELLEKLLTAPTQAHRFQDILVDGSGSKFLNDEELAKVTVHNFEQNQFNITGSQGGWNSPANTESFPILVGAGLAVNLGTVGPCGVLLPHVHPRANEFFIVVDNELDFGTRVEIGVFGGLSPSPEYTGKLKKNSGTLFPQGSVHYQINNSPNCKESTFVVYLSSEDPGTTTVLQEPVGNGTLGRRQVGREDFEMIRAVTPPHIVSVLDKCFARCNIV
ncbi:RmlC-like cupin domain-containing protein [Clohesyomyces aquaticus]|uniref:RmlC-like cupin domain-containing protein n=1 Tax=Clohesyomyces aquaticus TaxID=1231657 RepID=A0A1Y2A9J2_9PLEO|nr:RmlC-like cupin domain-containing protein [Clohesyomyces aquaticus]